MNIAVTGSLGSGKSTVSKILAVTLSADHLDTDQICRQEMLPGNQGYEGLLRVFGNRFFFTDGTLNRQLLRQAVFADSAVKKELEMILHPLVRQQVADCYKQCLLAKKNLVVEVPLLFEVGWEDDFSVRVVVYISDEQCDNRVAARDGLTEEEILQVRTCQLPLAEKVKRAHYIVNNSGTFVSTVQQITWLGRILQRRENDGKNKEYRSTPDKGV